MAEGHLFDFSCSLAQGSSNLSEHNEDMPDTEFDVTKDLLDQGQSDTPPQDCTLDSPEPSCHTQMQQNDSEEQFRQKYPESLVAPARTDASLQHAQPTPEDEADEFIVRGSSPSQLRTPSPPPDVLASAATSERPLQSYSAAAPSRKRNLSTDKSQTALAAAHIVNDASPRDMRIRPAASSSSPPPKRWKPVSSDSAVKQSPPDSPLPSHDATAGAAAAAAVPWSWSPEPHSFPPPRPLSSVLSTFSSLVSSTLSGIETASVDADSVPPHS